MSVAVIDSFGTTLMVVSPEDGAAIRVPAANLGGAEGRVVEISGMPAFDTLVDSLVRTESRFALRVELQTTGGDADESDNVKTREWARWLPLVPGNEMTIKFSFLIPPRTSAATVRTYIFDLPTGARVLDARSDNFSFLRPGHHTREVRLVTPKRLTLGSAFATRLTLTDTATGSVLQQHEEVAVFDTIPPMLGSYRAVLLRDGRIAIQVQAGDRHAGVSERGVATHYSRDGGATWLRQIHHFVEDDFGRPALFETVLGPFSPGDDLLIGVSARDRVGNRSVDVPLDAGVFAAPPNAELIIDALGVGRPGGNPIFTPAAVARRAAWVETAEATGTRPTGPERQPALSKVERFRNRRLQELSAVPTLFRRAGADVTGFARVDSPVVRFYRDGRSEWTVLLVRAWR